MLVLEPSPVFRQVIQDILMAAGYEAVLLANGTNANHTNEESVPASNILAMLEICESIVQEAASTVREAA